MLILLGVLFGCSDKGTDTGQTDTAETADTADTVDTAVVEVDCSTLSENECGDNELCLSIMGYPVDIFDEDLCYEVGDPLSVGCMSADIACGDAITYATSPDDKVFMFMDTCTPADWGAGPDLSMFSEGCSPISPSDCSERSVDECVGDDACIHIFGARRNDVTADGCYELDATEPVGCMSVGEACEPVVVNGSEPTNGDCYQFNSGCKPAGWGTCDDIDLSWPECALSCADYSPELCVSQSECSIVRGSLLEVDATQECYTVGANEPLACMDADMICGDAITFAADADGLCMMFSDTCIPEGWSLCDELNAYAECSVN